MAFPTTPKPDYVFEIKATDPVHVSESEDGTKRSVRQFAENRLGITLHWPVLTESEVDTLWTFFQTVRGQKTTFTYAHPDGGAAMGNFRMLSPNMGKDLFEANLYTTGLVLTQVYEYTVA